MLQKNDVTKIYDTVLSIPGMNENIKLTLQISRKNILLLNKAIERGLQENQPPDKTANILDIVPKEILQELTAIAVQLLDKAGLTEMNEKLKSF